MVCNLTTDKHFILVISGGITPADMSDESTIAALKKVLMEFKRRAYSSGNMKPRDTILVGEVLNVDKQVHHLNRPN